MKTKTLFQIMSIIVAFLPLACLGQEEERQHLFGDWGGKRTQWEDEGIAINSILTNDFIANVEGGLSREGGVLGNYDLSLELDPAKLGWWENGTIFTYFIGNYGKNPTEFVGDLQGTDNIETFDTFKLYEAWYQHSFFDQRLSLLVGLHDYNSEFDALDYAGTLIHPSFGISPDISQVGPSIFSTTSLALRARVELTKQWYLLSAAYDGVPGEPNKPTGTRIKLRRDDGIFYAVETGLVAPEECDHYKVAFGAWRHTVRYQDFQEKARSENAGIYAIAEAMLLPEEDKEQGLGVFAQSGFTQSDRNQIGNYFGGGITYVGLFPGRDGDTLSLAAALARNGGQYRGLNPEADTVEVATELTYRIAILPYFSIQPDIQYISNPGTDSTLDDALVLGVRTEIDM